jgi:hypothetical protein
MPSRVIVQLLHTLATLFPAASNKPYRQHTSYDDCHDDNYNAHYPARGDSGRYVVERFIRLVAQLVKLALRVRLRHGQYRDFVYGKSSLMSKD